MKPQDELEFLKGFIELNEFQAIKRDNLEAFLNGRSKVLLVDADSMLFNVVYAHEDRDFDLEEQYEDFNNQIKSVKERIEADGFDVEDVVYLFTTCRNNFRKELLPSYKANRKPNEMMHLVSLLKNYTIQSLEEDFKDVRYSDTLEADDLVRPATIEFPDCIIVGIDKDINQIEGAHFNYYRDKVKDENGCNVLERFETPSGFVVEREKKEYRGWSFTTKQEGYELLLGQLLLGDTTDNIKGAVGIGKKGVIKILKDKSNFGMLKAVAEAYKIYEVMNEESNSWEFTTKSKHKKSKLEKRVTNDFKRLRLNIKLMKL